MALTDKLTAIADAVRAKTGGTELLTLDEMAAAISGISGGGVTGLAYDMGEFVLDADSDSSPTIRINHNFGELPGFVLVWTDDYVGVTNPDTVYQTSLGFLWMNQIMGLDNWFTSVASGKGTTVLFTQSKGGTGMNIVKPSSQSYTIGIEGSGNAFVVNPEYFELVRMGNSIYWRGGVTYKYFVSKAWWNIGGVENAE